MEFSKFSLPPAANWFGAHILDVSVDGVIAYGSKSSVVLYETPKIVNDGKHRV